MSTKFRDVRSRSASDILEVPSFPLDKYKNIEALPNIRRKCYSDKKLSKNAYVTSDIIYGFQRNESSVRPQLPKSRNFVKRLASSMRRRNQRGECKADDEFFAKYSRPSVQQEFHREEDIPSEKKFATYRVSKKRTSEDVKRKNLENESCENRNTLPSLAQNRYCVHYSENFIYPKDLNENFHACSFDKTDSDVEADDSWLNKAMRKPACIKTKEEAITRKRSFRNFFGMMRRKKPVQVKTPRRFKSCDDLDTSTAKYAFKSRDLPRAVSLQAVSFKEYEPSVQVPENATIHPIYGARRHTPQQSFAEEFRPSTEFSEEDFNRDFESLSIATESLIKPSAVRSMARRLSQLPEHLWNRKENREDIPNRRHSNFLGASGPGLLENGNSYTLPIDRKLRNEYSLILGNRSNVRK